jgi:peptide/nickel transport system permease protein
LLQAALVVLVMSFVLYSLIGLMPGDPVDHMLEGNPSVTPEIVARMRALYGLDQPLIVRYWRWLMSAFSGDLGYSALYFKPVQEILMPAMLQTLKLMALTIIASIPLALALGVVAARRPNGVIDTFVSFLAFAFISSPVFWIALIFIIVFAVKLQWFPASGTALLDGGGLGTEVWHLFLPVLTLTLHYVGILVRYVRASMIETLGTDFVRTARAKGLPDVVVLMRHALRNALIPMVTVLALSIGTLFSGALVVETMFGMLGMGKMIFDAITHVDFNLALVGLLLATIVTLACSLLADLAYAWLDPRITLK